MAPPATTPMPAATRATASPSRAPPARGPGYIYTGAGADILDLPNGGVVFAYDSASGSTGKDHDMLVIGGLQPTAIDLQRKGPHLLICGRAAPIELMVLRQYCRGDAPGDSWNNGFEEIVFPGAREIWIADALFAHYHSTKEFLAAIRADEIEELQIPLRRNPNSWRVRPFSDVLPSDWFAPFACRNDLA